MHALALALPVTAAPPAARRRISIGLDLRSSTVSWPKLTRPHWQGSVELFAAWWMRFLGWHARVALREVRSEVMRALEPLIGPWLSEAAYLGYSTTIRNNKLQAIIDAIDLGAGAGLIKWYDGVRPATGGTVTTLLGTLTCSDPSATKSGGVLTFSAIASDTSADATATVTWGRVTDSTATFCFDLNIAAAAADIIVNAAAIVTGAALSITSWTITDGNP